jgi:hypothetical protein
MRIVFLSTIALAATLSLTGGAHAGPVNKAKNAVDPDCSVGKAAKGAVERSTVGVGNRCKPAETARDVVGVDKKKHGKGDGPLKKQAND